jgi:hypothetical protein
MEPEGVVHVLRELLGGLAPGGVVVDLLAVPPNEQIEAGGEILGQLDSSAFFPRARQAAAGLDALVDDGLLVRTGGEHRFTVVTRYPTGRDAIDDIAGMSHTELPYALERRLATTAGPVALREHSLVRTFRKRR